MTAYRQRLSNWVNTLQRDYPQYLPKGFPLNSITQAPESTSDRTLDFMASILDSAVQQNYNFMLQSRKMQAAQAPKQEEMCLVPSISRNGKTVYLRDMYRNKIVAVMSRQSGGLASYSGPKEYIEVMFGRGGLDRMWNRYADGNFANEVK